MIIPYGIAFLSDPDKLVITEEDKKIVKELIQNDKGVQLSYEGMA